MSVHESIFGVPLLTNIKSCSTLYQDTRLYHVSDALNSHQVLTRAFYLNEYQN